MKKRKHDLTSATVGTSDNKKCKITCESQDISIKLNILAYASETKSASESKNEIIIIPSKDSKKKQKANIAKDHSILQHLENSNMIVSFKEIKGDLFKHHVDDGHVAFAHCISRDFHMGKGIAVDFKKRFGSVACLLKQDKKVGECAVLNVTYHKTNMKRFVFYLVTKDRYYGKPTMQTLESTLIDMKKHCQLYKVKQLAIPRLGCGLDRLDWIKVKTLISKIFSNTGISFHVYFL